MPIKPKPMPFKPSSVDSAPPDPVELKVKTLRDELDLVEGTERGWSNLHADLQRAELDARAHRDDARRAVEAWTPRQAQAASALAAAVSAHEARLTRLPGLKAKLAVLEAGQREERRQIERQEAEARAKAEAAEAEAQRLAAEEHARRQPERDELARQRREAEATRRAAEEARVADVEAKGRAALGGKGRVTA